MTLSAPDDRALAGKRCRASGALADDDIGAEGARALAEALKRNSALQWLLLNGEPSSRPAIQ